VIDTYPDSTFVAKAREKIEMLKERGTRKAAAPVALSEKKPKRVVQEKRPWSPFSFKSGKPRMKAEAAAPETSKKKTWNPFSFKSEKKKTEPVAPRATQVPEAQPKKRPWNLFDLGVKREPVIKESAKKESVVKEVPKKNVWKPLFFGTNDEPMSTTNKR